MMNRKWLLIAALVVFIFGTAFAYNSLVIVKILGTDGTHYAVKFIDGKPRVSSMPYLYDIAEKNVSGHTPWTKIGQTSTASTNTEDVWEGTGTYYPPTSGVTMQIQSSSANDNSTGSGVRTAIIYYLDSNYAEKTETLTMNGLAAVTTTAIDIFRINAIRAGSIGTAGAAAGNIVVRNTLTGNTPYARINTGYTRGRNSFYTVPAGQSLFITSVVVSSSLTTQKASALFTTRATYDDKSATRTAPLFYFPFHEVYVTDSSFLRPLEIPTKLPEKTDLKVSVQTSSASANCAIALRGWLENN